MAKRKENEDEIWAKDWLRRQGYSDIRRPCDDPPDFVVDGHAVEVTRLNQRIIAGNDKQSIGVEEAQKPLEDGIRKIIDQLGSPGNDGCSWVINCEYDFAKRHPIPKVLTRQISEALTPLLRPYDESIISSIHSKHFNCDKHAGEPLPLGFPHLCLECGVCLDLAEFHHKPATFILQNVSDGYGVDLAEELAASVRNRLSDKSMRVRKKGRIGKYKSWWLILVDHVCHMPLTFLSESELALVRDQRFDFWSRVSIVSSQNPSWHYEALSR
ncbi:MAG: hypothetical protein OXQ84_05795 [bacterium]|nr:hypothetical protein [bacterium]